MKNIPPVIYLQVDPENERPEDFNKLAEVTWCKDRILKTDLTYYRRASKKKDSNNRLEDEMKNKDHDANLVFFDTLEFCCGAISDAIHGKLEKGGGEAVIELVKRLFERHGKKFNMQLSIAPMFRYTQEKPKEKNKRYYVRKFGVEEVCQIWDSEIGCGFNFLGQPYWLDSCVGFEFSDRPIPECE